MQFNYLWATLLGAAMVMPMVTTDDLKGIKGLVDGDKQAKQEFSAKHLDGEVYFASKEGVAAFKKEPAKYETKANHQLTLTGQYKQKACPITGGGIDEKQTSEIGGVKVGFCCGKCKKKVDSGADVAAKANYVFSKAAFAKAYEKAGGKVNLEGVKCFMMPKRGVTAEHAVDFKDGKIFFCCKGCPKKYAKDPEKFVVMANEQLVQTGQYTQKGCPFSGAKVNDKAVVKINGVDVKFCCEKCQGKVAAAADDKARADMVYGDKTFTKGFAKK